MSPLGVVSEDNVTALINQLPDVTVMSSSNLAKVTLFTAIRLILLCLCPQMDGTNSLTPTARKILANGN